MDQSAQAKGEQMITHKEFKEIKNRAKSNEIATDEAMDIIQKLICYAEDLREDLKSTNEEMNELDSELELLYEKYNELEKSSEKLKEEMFSSSVTKI